MMSYNFENKMLEAADFMGTPKVATDYIKLIVQSRFCCSSCCPNAWHSLKEHLSPWGNLDERKMIKVESSGTVFVYEHHETGAEIIAYIALGTALVTLAKSIVDLIVATINGMKRDSKTKHSTITIIVNNGEIKRNIFGGLLPLLDEESEALQGCIRTALEAKHKDVDHPLLLPKPVVLFTLNAPDARNVKLAGNFNGWNGEDMIRRAEGIWFLSMTLKPGRYEYKFVVDGRWQTDPCGTQTRDDCGNSNSVIDVE